MRKITRKQKMEKRDQNNYSNGRRKESDDLQSVTRGISNRGIIRSNNLYIPRRNYVKKKDASYPMHLALEMYITCTMANPTEA